jgi:hypothetical protein
MRQTKSKGHNKNGNRKARTIPQLETGRKAGTYLPPGEQGVILGLSASGMSRSAIARAVGRDRDTVAKILDKNELEMKVHHSRSILIGKAPLAAAKLVSKALGRGKNTGQLLVDWLRGIGVLNPKSTLEIEGGEDIFAGRSFHEITFYVFYRRFPSVEELPKFAKTHPAPALEAEGKREA